MLMQIELVNVKHKKVDWQRKQKALSLSQAEKWQQLYIILILITSLQLIHLFSFSFTFNILKFLFSKASGNTIAMKGCYNV